MGDLNKWIEENYSELYLICNKISRKVEEDLCQFCIEQFISNPKTITVPDNEKLFFFTRIVMNNYNSKSSRYHKIYRANRFEPIDNIELPEKEYVEDEADLDWVITQIKEDKKTDNWYFARIFEIYITLGCSITLTSKFTTIPLNSVSRDLKKYRKQLIDRRNKMREDPYL
jgi:hypothetical protein